MRSKAAVRMFAKAVTLECAQRSDGIRVNTIFPGGVMTPMWQAMPFCEKMQCTAGSADTVYQTLAQAVLLKRFAMPAEIAELWSTSRRSRALLHCHRFGNRWRLYRVSYTTYKQEYGQPFDAQPAAITATGLHHSHEGGFRRRSGWGLSQGLHDKGVFDMAGNW